MCSKHIFSALQMRDTLYGTCTGKRQIYTLDNDFRCNTYLFVWPAVRLQTGQSVVTGTGQRQGGSIKLTLPQESW